MKATGTAVLLIEIQSIKDSIEKRNIKKILNKKKIILKDLSQKENLKN